LGVLKDVLDKEVFHVFRLAAVKAAGAVPGGLALAMMGVGIIFENVLQATWATIGQTLLCSRSSIFS